MPYSKEKRKEYDKKYRELNREKIREQKAEYYKLNKEKIIEQISEYNQLNKEKRAEYYKKYRELNREKIRQLHRNYKKEAKIKCVEYLGGKCVKCGTTHNLQFDHIKREGKKYTIAEKITYSFGYLKEELDKCQLLCAPCHLDKTAKEWITQRGDG